MSAALARHDVLMRRAITKHGGFVFKTIGDAFRAAFARPDEAIAAAVDAQRMLRAEDFSAVEGVSVRMALHTGTADERDGDYSAPRSTTSRDWWRSDTAAKYWFRVSYAKRCKSILSRTHVLST